MNPKPNPILWLLSGFLSCAVLLTGILWWRGGGNPFLKTAADDSPPVVAAPAIVQAPAAADSAAVPAPVASAETPSGAIAAADTAAPPNDPAPSAATVIPPVTTPAPSPADPAPPVPEAVKAAVASSNPSAIASLAALAKDGAVPQDQLTDAAYQWGALHLPADPAKQDVPFEDVLKLMKTAATPEERGYAAIALAGSGRSTEALEAIQKASNSLTIDSPERFLMEEAVKLANAVPDEAAAADDKGTMKATAPKSPKLPSTTAAAPAKPKKDEGTGETVKRPVLPHETPEEAARMARRLKEAADDTEPAAPSLTTPPPPVSVLPMPASGGSRQTKIQPAN